MKPRTYALAAVTVAVTVGAVSLPANAAAPCRPTQLRAAKHAAAVLRSRVARLRAENRRLATQITTLTTERDEARTKLADAQSGVPGAVRSMDLPQVWSLLSVVGERFRTARYSSSYYTNGTDYQSWSFTYCGFC